MQMKGEKMLRKRINNIYIFINFLFLIVLIIGVILSLMPFISARTKKSVPNFFGNSIVIIDSDSMLPEFRNDQVIIVNHISSDKIVIGDRIAYYVFYENGSIAKIEFHEVVDILIDFNNKYFFEVKGTANLNLEQNLVHQDSVIGKYRENAGFFVSAITFSFSKLGILLLIVLPIISLLTSQVLFSIHINTDKEKKKLKHETYYEKQK